METRDTITIQKSSLARLVYFVPLCSLFMYFSKQMLFGPNVLWLQGVTVTEDLQIIFKDSNGKVYLAGQSDFNKPDDRLPEYCRHQQNNDNMGCLQDNHNQRIKIITDTSGNKRVSCYKVQREGLKCVNQMVKDCYNLGDSHWYGGFEAFNQMWPLKKAMPSKEGTLLTAQKEEPEPEGVELAMGPYVSGDFGIHKVVLANVLERLFISSSGVGIMVSKDSPLYLSFNAHKDGKICLAGMYDGSHYFSHLGKPPVLEYTVCKANNVKEISDYMRGRFLNKPGGTPSLELFHHPIWSTWAQYNRKINQTAVMDFADKIRQHKFPAAQLEIDDRWTVNYGDLDFDEAKFPDPKQMVASLNKKGFAVSLWTHPFLSLSSASFKEAMHHKYIVMARGSDTPALVRWWNEDMSALLDVTNPAAVLWYLQKLTNLKDLYNISSFKFDAGEAHFVPHAHHTFEDMVSSNEYATLWAELAYSADPTSHRQEVRVGWDAQKLPIFVRLFDRMSSWDRQGGLVTVIPSVLTLGIIGYPFVLPDMIGGNAYADMIAFEGGAYPRRELYIRWLELNTFLPAVQFSVVPWIYDDEVIAITRNYLQIREQYAKKIVELAEDSVMSGFPIVRPLWWIAPNDQQALVSEDEYLLGDDLLVAPVVVEGARKRDIYLPAGSWNDKLRGGLVQGPTLLKDYPVALEELAFFEQDKVSDS
ncbi:unnamed protein product [Lymnaea stagnalis]|uniref:Uncharacterized protein n=1 Tax=Lymnaea stagnalis TaxID=6523 RepID=A0AAV2HT66_LYMST